MLTNCAPAPVYVPAVEPAPAPEAVIQPPGPIIKDEEAPEAVTYPMEPDTRIDHQIMPVDDPWELLSRAGIAADSEASALRVRAIAEFIHRGQRHTARSVIEELKNYPLTSEQRISLQIIQGQLAGAAGRHEKAISLLSTINRSRIVNMDGRQQLLKTLSTAQIALGRKSDAVTSLLELDLLLADQVQLENQHTILTLLQSMDALNLLLLKENSSNPVLAGWIALTDTLKTTTPMLRQTDLDNWRLIYPHHPARRYLSNQSGGWFEPGAHKEIALLLPLTSPYGSAARAFYDGFMQAHSDNFSSRPPRIILYDVGEEHYLTPFYYQTAVNQGADFIVGPLGRKAADALLSTRQPEVATLLIADILPGYATDNLFGISLSPEQEARQVADRAFADGHRRATVFRADGEWGARVATAFISRWQDLGGVVVKSASFPVNIPDYSPVIREFLGLDKSIARQRLLQAQVGTRLHFSPRRNEDMDVLFLAANAEQSRLVVPQLRFFQAHDLPIYATSYVYSGTPDPAVDADLDGLVLGDMKWMFDSVASYKLAVAEKKALRSAQNSQTGAVAAPDAAGPESVSAGVSGETPVETENLPERLHEKNENQTMAEQNPYKNSELNRLYALGLQSYEIVPRLQRLRNNSRDRFFGKAMTVSVAEDGNVVRHPVWARFSSGLAEPVDPVTWVNTNAARAAN